MNAKIQAKFAEARAAMNASLIERQDEIDVVLTALIAGENPLLVGNPGTGKSFLLDAVMRWMGDGCRSFSVLFNKFTTPEEVFGPVSLAGLKADIYRRVTTGKLPESTFAFCDEIFKASSAILNTLLRILNERVYENGDGVFRPVPLQICVAASNEWPHDQEGGKELGALFDRFLLRKKVRTISTVAGRRKLLWAKDHSPKFTSTLSTKELNTARDEAAEMEWTPEAMEAFETILTELNKAGVAPGDRRQKKTVKACQAYAYLCGSDTVKKEHLEIAAHCLWDDPTEQPEVCAKIVARIANPVGMEINSALLQIEEILATAKPTDAVPKLQAIQKTLSALPDHNRKASALAYAKDAIKTMYDAVIGK